jgi:hypothetical protein
MQTQIRYISAEEACRQVTLFVAYRIADLLQGDKPLLVQHEQESCWRVPVVLHSRRAEPLGVVGYLDVNAQTGKLDLDYRILRQILANTQQLASRLLLRLRWACQPDEYAG